jgi:hypothetical protein
MTTIDGSRQMLTRWQIGHRSRAPAAGSPVQAILAAIEADEEAGDE